VPAEQREQRGQEGQCRQHRQPDHRRAGDPDRAQDHELEQDQAEEAEQHGQAAEEHGATRCRDRDPDRLADAIGIVGRSVRQLLPEPARQQQRIVDPQTEPEQRRQIEHEDAHRRQLSQDEDRRQRHEDARAADDQRHTRCDHRAEDEQQRKRRKRQRDDLASLEVAFADALDVAVERRAAGQLDGHARRLTQPFPQDRQRVRGVVCGQVEQDDVIRRMPVGRDLTRSDQVGDDPHDVRRTRDVAHG
jgi:hypothetical protein